MKSITAHKTGSELNRLLHVEREPDDCGTYLVTHGEVGNRAPIAILEFQRGPVEHVGINGLSEEILLEIIIDRFSWIQDSDRACSETGKALRALRFGLVCCKARSEIASGDRDDVKVLRGHRTDSAILNIRFVIRRDLHDHAGYFVNSCVPHVGVSISLVNYHIAFQRGDLKEIGVNGLSDEVVLAIVLDRLECYQQGLSASSEGAQALSCVDEALRYCRSRDSVEKLNRRFSLSIEDPSGAIARLLSLIPQPSQEPEV